jgi:hypothetical protein
MYKERTKIVLKYYTDYYSISNEMIYHCFIIYTYNTSTYYTNTTIIELIYLISFFNHYFIYFIFIET